MIERPLQQCAKPGVRCACYGFPAESCRQQLACLSLGQAARAQIEQRARVQLTHGGPMRRLDFVGMDLEHRLAVDLGAFGQQQVLVREVGIAAIGPGADRDAPVERGA